MKKLLYILSVFTICFCTGFSADEEEDDEDDEEEDDEEEEDDDDESDESSESISLVTPAFAAYSSSDESSFFTALFQSRSVIIVLGPLSLFSSCCRSLCLIFCFSVVI